MTDEKDYFGHGGRLMAEADPSMVHAAYQHDINDLDVLLPGLQVADLAHVLALLKSGNLPEKIGHQLIGALLALNEDKIEGKPELGDVYNSKEYALKKRIGDAAGWLHFGRARREAINNGFLISFRQEFIQFYEETTALLSNMVRLGFDTRHVLMPDFTYLLPAQPTYLGHYLGTFISPLLRDLERMEGYYTRLNTSWAGIGSTNGNSIGLSREYLARCMGFAAVADHCRDAMWRPDILNEGIFLLANTFTGLCRLANELIIFNTKEFNYIEIDDSFARASVVMPQKKNPYALAYLRGLCNEILGKLQAYLLMGKEASGFPDSRTFIYGDIIRSFEKGRLALRMFSKFMQTLQWNKEKLQNALLKESVYASTIAEQLSLKYTLDYKTSHRMVGKAVQSTLQNPELTFAAILEEIIRENSLEIRFDVAKWLEDLQNAPAVLERRNVKGGTSKLALQEYFDTCQVRVRAARKTSLEWKNESDQFLSFINTELSKLLKTDEYVFKPSFQTK